VNNQLHTINPGTVSDCRPVSTRLTLILCIWNSKWRTIFSTFSTRVCSTRKQNYKSSDFGLEKYER
jgi:hypothetical protein